MMALVAGACSGGDADEGVTDAEDSTTPVVQLPATANESEEAEASDDPLIPTTTLVVYPRTADYELVFLEVGDEYDPDIGVLGNRPGQIEFIGNMIAAQVHNDWDALYAMSTAENQAACPRDEYDEITRDLPNRDPIPIILNNISVSQSRDSVFGSFDILLPVEESDEFGFRVFVSPELVTTRDIVTNPIQDGEVGGLLTVSGDFLPYELLEIDAYDIDRLSMTQANGSLAKIDDGELKMAENPCVVAAKSASGVNGSSYWIYPEPVADEIPVDETAVETTG